MKFRYLNFVAITLQSASCLESLGDTRTFVRSIIDDTVNGYRTSSDPDHFGRVESAISDMFSEPLMGFDSELEVYDKNLLQDSDLSSWRPKPSTAQVGGTFSFYNNRGNGAPNNMAPIVPGPISTSGLHAPGSMPGYPMYVPTQPLVHVNNTPAYPAHPMYPSYPSYPSVPNYPNYLPQYPVIPPTYGRPGAGNIGGLPAIPTGSGLMPPSAGMPFESAP